MKPNENGGSAFPVQGGDCQRQSYGMSLRDYFAAAAMQGLLASQNRESYWRFDDEELSKASAEGITKLSYELADALLAERSAEKKGGV